jgi:hypothetical protein
VIVVTLAGVEYGTNVDVYVDPVPECWTRGLLPPPHPERRINTAVVITATCIKIL